MFNRTVFLQEGSATHSHHHTVTEKKAPTDESVKLLREMEKAAKDSIESSIRLRANDFDCVVRTFSRPENGDTCIRVLFSLNGQKMEAEHIHDQFADLRSLGAGVVKAVSDVIAETVLHELVKQIDKHGFVRKV